MISLLEGAFILCRSARQTAALAAARGAALSVVAAALGEVVHRGEVPRAGPA